MRKLMLGLLLSLPLVAAAESDAQRLCESLKLAPAPCYAHWVPNSLSLVSMGVILTAKEGRTNEHGAKRMRETEEGLYQYALPVLKDDARRMADLKRAHAFAQQSLRAIMPKEGLAEADRVKEVDKRRAHLEKLVAKLKSAEK